MSRCYSSFALADRRRVHQLAERTMPINEMARQLGRRLSEDGIGARRWFFDPSAPWQKGAVENANKRIRTSCQAIPTWQRCHNTISPNALDISTTSPEGASVTGRRPNVYRFKKSPRTALHGCS